MAVAAVACIRVGLEQFIEYDGWIHIFVSRAETLQTFHEDWHKTTHPPLYFLLLKAFSFLGTSPLAYRALSIVPGLVAMFMVGKIAERITSSRALGVLAAAGFGLSAQTVIVACEVRSYMLAAAFMLIALDAYLAGRKWLFSAAVTAGILTLYATAFFLAAVFVIAVARRRLVSLWPAFVAPALVLAIFYRHHMWQFTRPLNYMAELYFDPARGTLLAFLLNGIRQQFNLFSPFAITSSGLALALTIAFLAVALIVTWRAREASVPVLMLLILSAQIVVASALGKYPLGGQLRHQFLIYPFIVLSIVSVAGVFRRHAVILILAFLVAANAVAGYRQFHLISQPLFASEVQKFRAVVPPSALLYLDEFSTIAFFSRHPEWDWHLASADSTHTLYYEVTKDGRSMQIVRVRNQWNLKAFDETLYRDLRKTMDLHGARTAGLFALSTIPPGMPADEVRSRVAQAAATQRLAIGNIFADGPNLYARLSATP